MSKVRFQVSVSLDGYVAGPNQSLETPLGEGGEEIASWVHRLKSFRELQGMEGGGETGPSDDVFQEAFTNLGATVMGRNMFGPIRGPWGDSDWRGWWGESPPFHTPVFVLTHHPRQPLEMDGGTTFIFVTDGIEPAIAQAKAAAGDRDVHIGGGGSTLDQALAAGFVDEFELHVVPSVLGAGTRLFQDLGSARPRLQLLRTVPTDDVTHLKYRVIRD